MAVGDELYLKGDANRPGSVRLLEVADTDGDGVPDHRLQVERDGRWIDSSLLNPTLAAKDATAQAAAATAQAAAVAAQAKADAALPSTGAALAALLGNAATLLDFTNGAAAAVTRLLLAKLAERVSVLDWGATGDGVIRTVGATWVGSKYSTIQAVREAIPTHKVTLGNNAATSWILPATTGGFYVSDPTHANWVHVDYDTSGPTCTITSSAGSVTATTGILTGTSVAGTNLSVSVHTDGRAYIENRLGASKTGCPVSDINAADSMDAVAICASLAATGRAYLPASSVGYRINRPVYISALNQRITGDGRGSLLYSTSSDLIAFMGQSTSYGEVAYLRLWSQAGGGHCIRYDTGTGEFDLHHVWMAQDNDAKSVEYAPTTAIIIEKKTYNFSYFHTLTASVPTVDYTDGGGLLNKNQWRDGRFTNSGAYSLRVLSKSASTYSYENRIQNINFEVANGGAVALYGNRLARLDALAVYDLSTATTKDLFVLARGDNGASAGTGNDSIGCLCMGLVRLGGSLGTGLYDVVISGNFTELDHVFIWQMSSTNPKINANSKKIHIVGHNTNLTIDNGTAVMGQTGGGLLWLNPTVGTSAPSAGGAGALPATPLGYMTVSVAGTSRQIPYY